MNTTVVLLEQGPFKRLRYSVIGDDSAPSFFKIDAESGEITINRDLKETDLLTFFVGLLTRILSPIYVRPSSLLGTILCINILR